MPPDQQNHQLAELTDEAKACLAYKWDGWIARPNQLAPAGSWRIWLIMAGRGYGKTRIGAEWTRASVKDFEYVNLIGATADDARDIMIEGESGILAICPPWERPEYRPSKRRLEWPNGARSLIFTADEPERLRGKQHARIWADEIAAWKYPEAWDQALLGLRLGIDPRVVATTTPKPTRMIRELVKDPTCVVTRGNTYENLDNLADAFAAEIIKRYEGTRLGRQELDGELLEDEGLAYRFDERVHCVPAFLIPKEWTRVEGMDFGSSAPTAWLVLANDDEGHNVCFDEFYEPGYPSATAPQILARRGIDYKPQPWQAYDKDRWPVHGTNVVFGDPSIRNRAPWAGRMGTQTSVLQEFADLGVGVSPGNNDRQAGYIRLAELLRRDPERRFPRWHPYGGTLGPDGFGAPRLFFFADQCLNIVAQLREAPIEEDGKPHVGEAVDRDWEMTHGHAHAALRYWALSRPSPSKTIEPEVEDPRQALLERRRKAREQPAKESFVEF